MLPLFFLPTRVIIIIRHDSSRYFRMDHDACTEDIRWLSLDRNDILHLRQSKRRIELVECTQFSTPQNVEQWNTRTTNNNVGGKRVLYRKSGMKNYANASLIIGIIILWNVCVCVCGRTWAVCILSLYVWNALQKHQKHGSNTKKVLTMKNKKKLFRVKSR